MKRFKKVLALVLAGVLALAMLTACGETADPDSIMPEDGTPEVVMTVNNMAANKGHFLNPAIERIWSKSAFSLGFLPLN